MQQPVAEVGVGRLPISRVLATAIVEQQYRGFHLPKMLALQESITTMGWIETSLLTVQLLANGTYWLVKGLHRLKAVLELITVNSLPADYTVPCIVLSADTPANVLQEATRGEDTYARLVLLRERLALADGGRRYEGYTIFTYTHTYI
jgi:ParB-like chromosome segregation protein Spo0J